MQVGRLVGRTKIVGERDALRADGTQLGATLGNDRVFIYGLSCCRRNPVSYR